MGVCHLMRQGNGAAVVFFSIGIMPLLIALGTLLAAPHSVMAKECDPQVTGFGPTSSPDTVDALHANPVYGSYGTTAPTPTGYSVYTNNGQIPFGGYGTWSSAQLPNANYLGWRNLMSYDPNNCSAVCNGTATCKSFNLCTYSDPNTRASYERRLFQRSPLLEPSWNKSSPCYNPNSTVEIMCTLWNTPINMSAVDLNFGWPRGGFQVAIVGSKFYNKN